MKHLLSVTLLLIFFTGCVDRNQHRRMQMLLAETEAQDANCQWFTSDSLALSLVDYFSVYGTKSERAKAYYLLGRAYDNLGESSMAVLCYREASSTADTTDARMIARLHAYIGKQYVQYKSNSTDIATLGIQELRTAVRYAAMLNDTLLMRDCNQLISIVSEHLHRNDSLRGFKWKHRQGDTLELVNPQSGAAVLRARVQNGITNPNFWRDARVKVFSPDVITNFLHHRQEEHLKLERMARQQLYTVAIGFVFLIGVLMFYGYYRRHMRRQLMEINTRYALDLSRYNELRAERDRLNHQVEEKAKIEQQLADVKLRLTELYGGESWNMDSNQLSLAVVSDVHKCASLGRRATDADIQRLLLFGESQLPKFIEALRQYDATLTSQNLIFCLLVKLHFLPSELSVLLGKSPQAVTNQKRRLLRKLFKETGGAHEFDDKIRQLDIDV